MDSKCDVVIGEDFVVEYLTDAPSLQRYERNIFRTCVEVNVFENDFKRDKGS